MTHASPPSLPPRSDQLLLWRRGQPAVAQARGARRCAGEGAAQAGRSMGMGRAQGFWPVMLSDSRSMCRAQRLEARNDSSSWRTCGMPSLSPSLWCMKHTLCHGPRVQMMRCDVTKFNKRFGICKVGCGGWAGASRRSLGRRSLGWPGHSCAGCPAASTREAATPRLTVALSPCTLSLLLSDGCQGIRGPGPGVRGRPHPRHGARPVSATRDNKKGPPVPGPGLSGAGPKVRP